MKFPARLLKTTDAEVKENDNKPDPAEYKLEKIHVDP